VFFGIQNARCLLRGTAYGELEIRNWSFGLPTLRAGPQFGPSDSPPCGRVPSLVLRTPHPAGGSPVSKHDPPEAEKQIRSLLAAQMCKTIYFS